MSKKYRLAFFGIFFGIFVLAYTVGSTYNMSNQEKENFLGQFQSATQGLGAIGIFIHNTSVALPMFVPAFGAAWGAYAGWSTGAAFGALLSSNPFLPKIPAIAYLLMTPFGAMEVVAYSIGMSRSFLLIRSIIKRSLKKELLATGIEVGIVVAILLVAGFVENSIIAAHQTHVSLSR